MATRSVDEEYVCLSPQLHPVPTCTLTQATSTNPLCWAEALSQMLSKVTHMEGELHVHVHLSHVQHISICNSMVGRVIWDKHHEYCSGSGKLHEEKLSAICHFHYNTSGICPKFHYQPCYHTLIPYNCAPGYIQLQEHAEFVARWVGIK